jgi:hypothetical protein
MTITIPLWIIITLKVVGFIGLGVLAVLGILFIIFFWNFKLF